MTTTSEIIVTATIWILTAFGGFFTLRAAWRQRKPRQQPEGRSRGKNHECSKESNDHNRF